MAKWSARLDDPTAREDFGILVRTAREVDPTYSPPPVGASPEENRELLKQLLRDAYDINPLGLTKGMLGEQLSGLAKEYGGTRGNFIGEAMHWVVPHLTNRYFDRDVARGDGERFSTAVSSNCIEYWDPAKGGVVSHIQGYFNRTLKSGLLEHFCQERAKDGHKFYSIDAAKECGMDLATTKEGIRFTFGRGADNEEDDLAPGVEVGASDEKRKPNDADKAGPASIDLLASWLDRNAPEFKEGLVRGSRNERLVALKRGVEEVLKQGRVEDKEMLLEDFSLWDPRRVPLDQQYPEVVEFLADDSKEESIRKRVEQELNRDKATMFMFPDMEEAEIRRSISKKQESAAPDLLDLSNQMPASSEPQTPEARLAAMNKDLAGYLGVEIPAGLEASEVARALMREWADCVLETENNMSSEEAELMTSVNAGVKAGVRNWDFLSRSPMNLVQLAVTQTVDDQDIDSAIVSSLGDTISRNQSERRWLAQGPRQLKTKPIAAGRDEY